MSELTDKQRKLLQHTLGASPHQNKRNYGYRNHFLASAGSSDFAEFVAMESAGLAESGPLTNGRQYFRATVEGCKAIGLGKAAIKRAFEE